VRILFLDIDGVLNRTGFRPAESVGLRSWIEPALARRVCSVIAAVDAVVVLSSDWRRGRELQHLREELAEAGVVCSLIGTTPVLAQPRWREIEAWMAEHQVGPESVVIVDDTFDMGPLAPRFVRTSPLNGLDEDAARSIRRLFEGGSSS